MLFRILGIAIMFTGMAFCQTDDILTPKAADITENGIDYYSLEVNETSHVTENEYMPQWHEFITNVPFNIYTLTKNSFSSDMISSWGILAGSTAILMATDKSTYHLVKKNYFHNRCYHNLSGYAVLLGDGRTNFEIAGLFSIYGEVFDDNRSLRTGIQCAESIISTGLTVQLLKRISGRESPASAFNHTDFWRVFPNPRKYQKNQPKYYSFPSGHLSTAMTTLTVIADNYSENSFIRPIGYPLIGMLGLGLVAKDMHWFSDFPLAIALGYGFGKLITSANLSITKNESPNNTNISLMPVYINKGLGAGVLVSF